MFGSSPKGCVPVQGTVASHGREQKKKGRGLKVWGANKRVLKIELRISKELLFLSFLVSLYLRSLIIKLM